MEKKMSNNISNFFKSVLQLHSVSDKIQERIFQYGIKNKDYFLLTELIRRNDLCLDIEDRLKNVQAVNVKVEWAKKPHRTEDELIDLVKNEKRVKVLSALASREDCPETIFKAIAKHGKGQALEALLLNNKIDNDIKLLAAKRYSESAKVKNLKASHHVILGNDPIIANEIALHTKCLNLGLAALSAAKSNAKKESIENVISIFDSYLNTFDRAHYAENYTAINATDELVSAMQNSDYIDRDLLKKCKDSLKLCKSKIDQDSYYGRKVDDNLTELKKIVIKDKVTISLTELAKNVVTDIDKENLANLIAKQKTSIENSTYLAMARNENYSAEEIYDILANAYLGWYGNRALLYSINLLPADKAAALYLNSYHIGDDAVIEKYNNPHQLLSEAVKLSVKKNCIHIGLIKSKYMSKEMIKFLPLSIFMHDSVPINITSDMIDYMINMLGDTDSSWDTVASLADQYDGSCYDLIELSKTLS